MTVTMIGSGAFEGNQLTSVIIPSSVIEIAEDAFYNNPLTLVCIEAAASDISIVDTTLTAAIVVYETDGDCSN